MSPRLFVKIIGALLMAAPFGLGVCNAQSDVVRLASGAVSVENIIRETEKQTKYLFVYGSGTFDPERQVILQDQENKLSDLLGMITADKWRYEVRNRYIVISEMPKPKVVEPEVYYIPPTFKEEEIVAEKGTEFPTRVTPAAQKKNNVRPVVTPGL